MTETQSLEMPDSPEAQADAQPAAPESGSWSLSLFAWLLIALLAIIAILILVNAGIFIVSKLDRPKVAAPGALLYASNFDTASDEWYTYGSLDSAQITGGSLYMIIGDAKG